jgi:hypothetical protein
MEYVSIPIPTALFAEIYNRYGEETGKYIARYLESLIKDNQPKPSGAASIQHFMRPGPGTITGRVWEIADEIYEETGEMNREAVVTACMEEGIKMNTASTQYSHWKNAIKETGGAE